MRVLLRADASPVQGTGHVMRCLTLAEALKQQGHEVALMTNESGVAWLEQKIAEAQIQTMRTVPNRLHKKDIESFAPDWVVTDSYELPASEISAITNDVATLAIIDGDDRGIIATAYLDHNLGAENSEWPEHVRERLLAGSNFVLIRDAILEQLTFHEKNVTSQPHIVAVMGGSDPTGAIVEITKAIALLSKELTATVIVSDAWLGTVSAFCSNRPNVEIISPTTDLPAYLGAADIAISASGTSAWELCTLAKPSILIAVVDNQVASLQELVAGGLVLGIDATKPHGKNLTERVGQELTALLHSETLREDLSSRCHEVFDGKGKYRVVDFMEQVMLEWNGSHE